MRSPAPPIVYLDQRTPQSIGMDPLFSRMYDAGLRGGRPSIAPETLPRAKLLQVFCSILSELQLVEEPLAECKCSQHAGDRNGEG